MNLAAFHIVNATVNGHMLVALAMGLNAVLYFQRGTGLALIGILCGAVALTSAHIVSGMAADGKPGLQAGYVVCAVATALAWLLFILAAAI